MNRATQLFFRIIVVGIILAVTGCAGRGTPSREGALRPAQTPRLADDLSRQTLVDAALRSRAALSRSGAPKQLQFGEQIVPTERYVQSLAEMVSAADHLPNDEDFFHYIESNFDFHEVYGDTDWGDVVITSYYEPVIRGSRVRTREFSQPLYKVPATDSDRCYTRREINSDGALEGLGLELCYVDPVDAYLLQTQGSGVVAFEDGSELRLQFAAKNGYPYQGIGKALRKVMPDGDLRLPRIEAFLRSLTVPELNEYLNQNPSYVYFAPSTVNALTSMQIPATPGRTIAVDRSLFPKGAMGYLIFQKPHFSGGATDRPTFAPAGRFVFDQDVGSAIRGPGRIDLFWGRGDEAKQSAGVIHSHARLYYLLPKSPP
ncbi:MAG: MltA domain-containing protein [Bdellovibrionota bacterium]